MFLKRGLVIALFLSLSFAAIPPLTHATHSWGGYHWARTANPFTLQLDDNVSSAWDAYLGTTSSDWTQSAVMDTFISPGFANPKNCRPVAGRVEVCSASYGNTGWLGIAQIWISGLHITQGTVKLNDTYFNTSKYNTPGWRNLVSCQEVGHTFGLAHQDETFGNTNLGTCMDYTDDPTGTIKNQLDNEHPNQHDYDEVVTIYSHTDSTTTIKQSVNSSPAATNDDVQLGTGQWGKLIHSGNGGRTEVFELDLGRGRKILTRVVWADPEE